MTEPASVSAAAYAAREAIEEGAWDRFLVMLGLAIIRRQERLTEGQPAREAQSAAGASYAAQRAIEAGEWDRFLLSLSIAVQHRQQHVTQERLRYWPQGQAPPAPEG